MPGPKHGSNSGSGSESGGGGSSSGGVGQGGGGGGGGGGSGGNKGGANNNNNTTNNNNKGSKGGKGSNNNARRSSSGTSSSELSSHLPGGVTSKPTETRLFLAPSSSSPVNGERTLQLSDGSDADTGIRRRSGVSTVTSVSYGLGSVRRGSSATEAAAERAACCGWSVFKIEEGTVRGPTTLLTAAVYFFFIVVSVLAELLNWAPEIRFSNSLPYFFVCVCSLQAMRVALALNPTSIVPLYATLPPFICVCVLSREAHLVVSVAFLCCILAVHIQVPRSDLSFHLAVYSILFIASYVGSVALMEWFYVDDSGTDLVFGRLLDPPIHWGQEFTFVASLVLVALIYLVLERFVLLYGAVLAERERMVTRLIRANRDLRSQLSDIQTEKAPLDFSSPVSHVMSMIKDLALDAAPDVRGELDKVVQILSANTLYVPQVLSDESLDPEYQGYLDSLLHKRRPSLAPGEASPNLTASPTSPLKKTRRSITHAEMTVEMWKALPGALDDSGDTDEGRSSDEGSGERKKDGDSSNKGSGGSKSKPKRVESPEKTLPSKFTVEEAVDALDNWEFDIFSLAQQTRGHPLYFVGYAVFVKYDLVKKFSIDASVLSRFLRQIEAGYSAANSYHNSTHAADVTQALHYFFNGAGLGNMVTDIEIFAAFIAALVHDYQHPGVTSNFLINTSHPLAIIYNDRSVLENHHCASAFQLMENPNVNLLQSLSREDAITARELIVSMVLSTDMKQHFSIVGQFEAKVAGDGIDVNNSGDRSLLLQMALKCADVSNPARPEMLCNRWADAILKEFFAQGDREAELGLPISMMMDRKTTKKARSQKIFIDVFAAPLFTSFAKFSDLQLAEVTQYVADNRSYWTSLDELEPS